MANASGSARRCINAKQGIATSRSSLERRKTSRRPAFYSGYDSGGTLQAERRARPAVGGDIRGAFRPTHKHAANMAARRQTHSTRRLQKGKHTESSPSRTRPLEQSRRKQHSLKNIAKAAARRQTSCRRRLPKENTLGEPSCTRAEQKLWKYHSHKEILGYSCGTQNEYFFLSCFIKTSLKCHEVHTMQKNVCLPSRSGSSSVSEIDARLCAGTKRFLTPAKCKERMRRAAEKKSRLAVRRPPELYSAVDSRSHTSAAILPIHPAADFWMVVTHCGQREDACKSSALFVQVMQCQETPRWATKGRCKSTAFLGE